MITTAQGTFGVLLVPKKCPALVNIKTVVSVRQVASGGGATDVGPNITGKYNCSNLTNAPGSNLTTEGSLFNEQGSAPENATGEYRGTNAICLDASRSSTIFGQSMTVQPASLLLMPCIKI